MLAIARYALKSPFSAATVVGILAVLSLFIPMVSLLSGAIVGLIILTQGLLAGTRAIVVSIVGITAISYLLTQSPELGITIGLVQWLPMMILAEILRRTRSLSFTLVAGMVLAVLAVIVQFSLWPDSEKIWLQFMLQLFQGMDPAGMDMELFQANLQRMVHWMILMMVAVMYFIFIATLLASRWFQAKLADSAGFRDEFYAIRLGKSVAAVVLLVVLLSFVINQDWLLALMIVMLATFLYQGLAIAHSWSKAYKKTSWLVLLYMMIVIFPQVAGMTALLGIVDNWIGFREKLKSFPEKTD